jgi:catechol 2,3-dioxygenase-like lactoylglutathione lyase family enzyme
MITNPRLAVIYVTDQTKTLEFLTEKLGFEVTADVPYGDGQRWVEVSAPGAQTHVALAAVEPDLLEALRARAGRMTHGWFDCDDLDATCAALRARGVEITVEPEAASWREGSRWAQIRGHDGNLYGLTEPTRR